MSFGTYQRYEHGSINLDNISLKTALALCAVLEIDPYQAVFGMDRKSLKEELGKRKINL